MFCSDDQKEKTQLIINYFTKRLPHWINKNAKGKQYFRFYFGKIQKISSEMGKKEQVM